MRGALPVGRAVAANRPAAVAEPAWSQRLFFFLCISALKSDRVISVCFAIYTTFATAPTLIYNT